MLLVGTWFGLAFHQPSVTILFAIGFIFLSPKPSKRRFSWFREFRMSDGFQY